MEIRTLSDRIRELAKHTPDKLAVAFRKESLTYGELERKIEGISAFLRAQGVGRGERVCFSALSKPEMAATYLGIQRCGAVAVFLDKKASAENMAQICRSADAVLLLTDKPMGSEAGELRVFSLRKVYAEAQPSPADAPGSDNEGETRFHPESDSKGEARFHPESGREGDDQKTPVTGEDIAEILFTTGTTGKPKGVMLSYRAVYHILSNTRDGVGYSKDTVLLLPLPMHHSFALRVFRAVLYSGGTVVLQNGFTFAKEVEMNLASFGCNAMACVPASYEVIKGQMQERFKPVMSRLSILEFGAGSLTIAKRREITGLLDGVRIRNVWGSSESGGAIFCDVNQVIKDEKTAGSLGRPLEGEVEVAFLAENAPFDDPKALRGHVDEYRVQTDASHPGRMILRGEMLMSGYWKAEELTKCALVDGWLVTGDLAWQDAQGNLFMLGRSDDLINVGGEKVSPLEVENIAGQYDAVRDCACIGDTDRDGILGQVPVLFVVTRPGYSEAEFRKWMSVRMEKAMLPQTIPVVEEIPRNRMQKIDRRALRHLWENREYLSIMNPVVDSILSRRSIRKFRKEPVGRDLIDMILKCAIAAPTGHNMQSWRFTVLTEEADILRLKEAAAQTAKENHVVMYGFENPAVLILVSNDIRNPDGCQDASCAAQNMMLAAHSFGLGSVWLNVLMTLRDKEPVKSVLDEFGIPSNHVVWASVALGWPVADGVRIQRKPDVIHFLRDML